MSTEDFVLSAADRRAVLDNLNTYAPRNCKIRLSFLPFVPETFTERRAQGLIGDWKHVEISFEVTGPVGKTAFSAWSGHFPDLPDDAGIGTWMWRYLESMVRNPPILRGTYLAKRTYKNLGYTHIGFNVTSEQEAALFRACNDLHGCGFNPMGYYRSALWPSLTRTTTRDRFFCSEAVLTALQDSNILPSIVGERGDFISDLNPGSVTPSMLYDLFKPYGVTVMNQVHGVNRSAGRARIPTFFVASGDSSSDF
jgi:hypothetical protein